MAGKSNSLLLNRLFAAPIQDDMMDWQARTNSQVTRFPALPTAVMHGTEHRV